MQKVYARRILTGFGRGFMFAAISFLTFTAIVWALIIVQGQRDEARPAGAAIVLGAAQWNGSPSPVLRARLDHAFELYRRGLVGQIILTGGVGQGDTVSEAAAGKEYLVQRGLPAEVLLTEETGTTTFESMEHAAELARLNAVGSVLVVSDAFHMLRSLKIARDLGLTAYGAPTPTSPIAGNRLEEARFIVREGWAYLAYIFLRQ